MNLMADASVSIESVLKKKNPDTILRGLVKGAKEIENATTIMAEKARLLASTLDAVSYTHLTLPTIYSV